MVSQPGAGAGSAVANVIWFLLPGWILALLHIFFGVLLCITIIGIPFGVAHFKLAGLAVRPYGKDIVDVSSMSNAAEYHHCGAAGVNNLPWAYLAEFSEPDGYLDFAGIGPVSRRVEEALNSETAAIREAAEPLGSRFERTIGEAIAGAARLLGVLPDNVGIVASTGVGIFHVAFGISGGNVVVPAGEFPANLYPWFRAEQAGIIDEVRSVPVPDGRLVADVLRPYVDSDTSAVALSSVDYLTGFRADLEAMRELAEDALLVVDAIQGFGAFPLTLEPADVVIAGGQKWLRARNGSSGDGGEQSGDGTTGADAQRLARGRRAVWLRTLGPTAGPRLRPPLSDERTAPSRQPPVSRRRSRSWTWRVSTRSPKPFSPAPPQSRRRGEGPAPRC